MSQSIGAALKTAREQRHMTLAQVSEATRVRIHYLQALENDDISAMPSGAQARGFLRIYATFLGLDLEALIPPPAAVADPIPLAPPATEAPAKASVAPRDQPDDQGTGPLAGLRERLVQRLGIKTPKVEANPAAESVAPPESEAKKKARK